MSRPIISYFWQGKKWVWIIPACQYYSCLLQPSSSMMYKLSLQWTLDRWKWQPLFLISSLREHCSTRSKRAQGVYALTPIHCMLVQNVHCPDSAIDLHNYNFLYVTDGKNTYSKSGFGLCILIRSAQNFLGPKLAFPVRCKSWPWAFTILTHQLYYKVLLQLYWITEV